MPILADSPRTRPTQCPAVRLARDHPLYCRDLRVPGQWAASIFAIVIRFLSATSLRHQEFPCPHTSPTGTSCSTLSQVLMTDSDYHSKFLPLPSWTTIDRMPSDGNLMTANIFHTKLLGSIPHVSMMNPDRSQSQIQSELATEERSFWAAQHKRGFLLRESDASMIPFSLM